MTKRLININADSMSKKDLLKLFNSGDLPETSLLTVKELLESKYHIEKEVLSNGKGIIQPKALGMILFALNMQLISSHLEEEDNIFKKLNIREVMLTHYRELAITNMYEMCFALNSCLPADLAQQAADSMYDEYYKDLEKTHNLDETEIQHEMNVQAERFDQYNEIQQLINEAGRPGPEMLAQCMLENIKGDKEHSMRLITELFNMTIATVIMTKEIIREYNIVPK